MCVKLSSRCHQAKIVKHSIISHEIDYVEYIYDIFNPEGLLNCITDSKVAVTLDGSRVDFAYWYVEFHREGSAITGASLSCFSLQ